MSNNEPESKQLFLSDPTRSEQGASSTEQSTVADIVESLIPKREVDSASITKIHNEVNQLNNQRFLILMSSITASGVIESWCVAIPVGRIGDAFILTSVLILVLLAMCNLAYAISRMQRILTSYLRMTGLSTFELDWARFLDRHRDIPRYSKPIARILFLIGILANAICWIKLIPHGELMDWHDWISKPILPVSQVTCASLTIWLAWRCLILSNGIDPNSFDKKWDEVFSIKE